jgi:hypothetical protein
MTAIPAFIVPDGDDWIVTIAQIDGRVWTRRVSPGNISEREALRIALVSNGTRPENVADATIRRVGSVQSVVAGVDADDPFVRLVERMRLR